MTTPMPGSVAANQRAKLSPDLRAVCEMIDRELGKDTSEATTVHIGIYRNGWGDALRVIRRLIERGEISS